LTNKQHLRVPVPPGQDASRVRNAAQLL